ncbi:7681_t:CDS:2, partial [Racocetra fulgida]
TTIDNVQFFKPIVKSSIDLTAVTELISINEQKDKIDSLLESQYGSSHSENEKESNENGGNDENNDDGGNGSVTDNSENIIVTSSCRAVSKENQEIFQDFVIVVSICANVTPVDNKNYSKVLKFSVDIQKCATGSMLSEKSSLHKNDFGYFLDSVVIKVSTIRETSKGINRQVSGTRIKVTGAYNKKNAHNIDNQVSGTGIQVTDDYNTKNALNTDGQVSGTGIKVTDDYNTKNALNTDEQVSGTGIQVTDDNNTKNALNTDEQVSGTGIQVTDDYNTKNALNTDRQVSGTGIQVAAHILKISFDNIDNFERYYAKLDKIYYEQNDLIYDLKSKDFHKEDTQKYAGINDFT